MKIGIATFQWADNYGAVIQAYALQSYLEKIGNEVHIINYKPSKHPIGLKQYLAKTPRAFIYKLEKVYKKKVFQSFRTNYLNLSSIIIETLDDLKTIKDEFNTLIAGSDQVWNPKWLDQEKNLWDLYFLKFAGFHTKKCSYAASFGHAELKTMTIEWQEAIRQNLKNFDCISVREKSGVDIVRQLTGRNDAIHVVDPTFLLRKDDYYKLIGQQKKRKSYLFSYMLHGLNSDSNFLENMVSKELNIKVVKCDANRTSIHKKYILPTPIKWLGLIREADFIITNSFHAVVFCLIFHKQFIAILIDGELGSMNTRITNLLDEFNLSSRYITARNTKKYYFDKTNIDWDLIDKKANKLYLSSTQFISNNLI
jgi:hypothetical protein